MGGSPCKAWNWRNPIVQTLFTQGPARTASVPHKRAGGALWPQPAARRLCRPGSCADGEIRATSERVARRRWPASGLLSRPSPGFSGFGTALYQRPASYSRGGGDGLHRRWGKPLRIGGGAAGGQSPPGRGLRPRPCSALWAERRPPPPTPGTLAYRALSLAPSLESSTP